MVDEHDYIVLLSFKQNFFMKILNSFKELQFFTTSLWLRLQFKVRSMRDLCIFRLIKKIFALPKTKKVITILVSPIARV